MKTVTRALALVLALTLLLAMSATVFAADDTYTITISGDNVVAGHIYEAYQIFKGDLAEKDSKTILSNIEWGSSVNGDALLTALKADATLGNDFKDCTTAAQVADVLATYGSDAGKTQQFAKLAGANLNATVAGTSTWNESGKNYSISSLVKIPCSAPLPVPTMIAVGVASPSAQGQEITSTAIPDASAKLKVCPRSSHTTIVIRAMVMTTGTKTPLTLSASLAIGAGATCLLYQTDNLGKSSILADAICFHLEITCTVDSRPGHPVAFLLPHRNTLTGDGGFIHGSGSFGQNTIHRNALSRFYNDGLTDLDLLYRNL